MRLIDADALIEAAEVTTEFRQHLASVYDLESLVAGMPTIEAEPVRHGRWEKHGSKWQCTHCKVPMSVDGTPTENSLFFCPNCGAKMDLEDEA